MTSTTSYQSSGTHLELSPTQYQTIRRQYFTLRAMNRYGRGPTVGGPSKATATTLCQKCLKRDMYNQYLPLGYKADQNPRHYSYECKAIAQERPYVSRPSRTQQLLNPKLVPKLTSDVPQELLRKFVLSHPVEFSIYLSSYTCGFQNPLLTSTPSRKGVADEQLAKAEQERGRKRERQSEDPELGGAAPKRIRSASPSSASVSSISTRMSRSPSPRAISGTSASRKPMRSSISKSPQRRSASRNDSRSLSRSPSVSRLPPPPKHLTDSEKKRRRDSFSSADSYTSEDRRNSRNSRERTDSRSTRRRYQQTSPPARGRRTESRSPYRGRRRLSNDRQRGRDRFSDGGPPRDSYRPPPHRERSLSPFSKRLALTQAMNTSR